MPTRSASSGSETWLGKRPCVLTARGRAPTIGPSRPSNQVFLHKYATDKAEREKKLAASQHRRKAKKGDDEDAMDEDDVEGPDAFADAGDDADDADLAVMENASDADEFDDGISDSEVDAALQKSSTARVTAPSPVTASHPALISFHATGREFPL